MKRNIAAFLLVLAVFVFAVARTEAAPLSPGKTVLAYIEAANVQNPLRMCDYQYLGKNTYVSCVKYFTLNHFYVARDLKVVGTTVLGKEAIVDLDMTFKGKRFEDEFELLQVKGRWRVFGYRKVRNVPTTPKTASTSFKA